MFYNKFAQNSAGYCPWSPSVMDLYHHENVFPLGRRDGLIILMLVLVFLFHICFMTLWASERPQSYSITFGILSFNLESLMYQKYLLNAPVGFVLYLSFSKFPAVGHPLGLATVSILSERDLQYIYNGAFILVSILSPNLKQLCWWNNESLFWNIDHIRTSLDPPLDVLNVLLDDK